MCDAIKLDQTYHADALEGLNEKEHNMKDWYTENIYLTNDHHEVRQGDWISDTDGVYECQEVPGKTYDGPVIVREIIFDEEDPEKWEYGDTYGMDRFAIHRCSYQ